MSSKKRVLFISESVTLAHLARPLTLANSLSPSDFDVEFACANRYRSFLTGLRSPAIEIDSISSKDFLSALDKGNPVYDKQTLESYVEADIALLQKYQPDVVIGDFRISLGISARITNTPYITISNIYWSPFADLKYPVPDLPLVKILGARLAQPLFNVVRPIAFAVHAGPLNQVRAAYGLPKLGHDLRKAYTDADMTLYADIPDMFPTRKLPPSHRFIGSIQWQPPVSLPGWWHTLAHDHPVVFVSLGSSGRAGTLETVLTALADLPITVIASTAGHPTPTNPPANARIATYLPGREATALSKLVICNGGSPTAQAALVQAVPVLGICSNLDQYLNMSAVASSGAGLLLRSGNVPSHDIKTATQQLLAEKSFRGNAARLAKVFSQYQPKVLFRDALNAVLHCSGGLQHAKDHG